MKYFTYNPASVLCFPHLDEKIQTQRGEVTGPLICLLNSRTGVWNLAFWLQCLRGLHPMLAVFEAFSDPQKTCYVSGSFWRAKRSMDRSWELSPKPSALTDPLPARLCDPLVPSGKQCLPGFRGITWWHCVRHLHPQNRWFLRVVQLWHTIFAIPNLWLKAVVWIHYQGYTFPKEGVRLSL